MGDPHRFPILVPLAALAALIGATAYGRVLATSFALDAPEITSFAFLGLFVVGLALPVHRIEYILGVVVGMTVVFGGGLPLLVALVVALVVAAFSFVVRYSVGRVVRILRQGRTRSEVA